MKEMKIRNIRHRGGKRGINITLEEEKKNMEDGERKIMKDGERKKDDRRDKKRRNIQRHTKEEWTATVLLGLTSLPV